MHRDSWRAGRIETVHVQFGGERLVLLGNQDPASYPTESRCYQRWAAVGQSSEGAGRRGR